MSRHLREILSIDPERKTARVQPGVVLDDLQRIDETSALEPLERWPHDEVDLPEIYPSGI